MLREMRIQESFYCMRYKKMVKKMVKGDPTTIFLVALPKRAVAIIALRRDFPGGPVVKNPPSNAADMGLIPGQGIKIPHAAGQLSPRATTTELTRLNKRAHVPQTTELMRPEACAPQLERNLHTTCRNERSCMPQLRPDAAKKKKKKNK